VQPAKQPADAESSERHLIRLGLDSGAQPLVERRGRVARGVRGLTVQILRSPGGLIKLALGLRF
jgi:hypothetical protein